MPDEVKRLTKVSLRNFCGINEFRYTKDKKKKNRWLMLALTWCFVGIVMLVYIAALCVGLVKFGLADVLPEYLFSIAALCIFFFSIFKAGSVIFETHSYEMQISMPVRKSSIVLSRFLTMYASDVLISLAIMSIGMIVYGITMRPGIMFYIYGIIGTLLLPLIPLTLATAIGAVITAISSRMKHKSLVSSLFTVVFVIAILAGNFALTGNPSSFSPDSFTNLAETLSVQIGRMYPPALWLNNSMISGNVLSFLLLIAVSIILFAIMLSLVGRYFTAICSALKATSAKNNYKLENQKTHSVVNALFHRELKRYFASSIYVSNTIMGYILMAVASIVLFAAGIEKVEGNLNMPGLISKALPLMLGAIASLMSTTACSISLEGKQFWIAKTMPIKSKDVFDSKILVNLTVAAPGYLVAVVFGILAVKPTVSQAVMIIIIPALYILFSAVIGITINLALPNLHWENETQIVKQSASTLVAMLIGFISFVPPIAIMISSKTISPNTILTVTALILVVLTVILYITNNKKRLLDIF